MIDSSCPQTSQWAQVRCRRVRTLSRQEQSVGQTVKLRLGWPEGVYDSHASSSPKIPPQSVAGAAECQGKRPMPKAHVDRRPKAMIASAMGLMRVERLEYRLLGGQAGASLMGAALRRVPLIHSHCGSIDSHGATPTSNRVVIGS